MQEEYQDNQQDRIYKLLSQLDIDSSSFIFIDSGSFIFDERSNSISSLGKHYILEVYEYDIIDNDIILTLKNALKELLNKEGTRKNAKIILMNNSALLSGLAPYTPYYGSFFEVNSNTSVTEDFKCEIKTKLKIRLKII